MDQRCRALRRVKSGCIEREPCQRKEAARSTAWLNIGQAQRSLVSVVVRWMHVLRNSLQSGNLGDRSTILRRNIAGDRTSQRAMIAFNSHDAGSRHAQVGSAEVAHPHQIGSNESIFKGRPGYSA